MSVSNALYNAAAVTLTAVKNGTANAALAVATYLNPAINTVAQDRLTAAYAQGKIVGESEGEVRGYQQGLQTGQQGLVSKTKVALACLATAALTSAVIITSLEGRCYCY